MQRRTALTLTLVSLGALAACGSAPQVSDYANEKPLFDLKTYFSGTVDGWGIFTDRSGKVVKRFVVTMNCTWNGNDGVLDEDFVYSDGSTQKRVWRMQKLANGRYEGRADDVLGVGSGAQSGNVFRWGYTLNLPVDDKVYAVQFDDWMYQMDDNVMINKAVMRKFGFTLGELVVNFKKR
jgi:Protein of unknown function (DUF3833)